MAKDTLGGWRTTSWSPTTGCDRVLAGYDDGDALTFAGRLKERGRAKHQADGHPRTSRPGFALTLHPGVVELPRRWRKPRHVFVGSMSDLLHARQVVETMRETPQHTCQVLTRRARRLTLLSEQTERPSTARAGTSVEDSRVPQRADDHPAAGGVSW